MPRRIFNFFIKPSQFGPPGQGLVELSLVLPLFLLAVLGVVEMSRLAVIYIGTVSASREAARYGVAVGETSAGVAHFQDCDGIRGAAQRVSPLSEVSVDIHYDPDGPGGTSPAAYCPVGVSVDPINPILGGRIIVTATSQYAPLFGLLNLPAFPVSSDTKRTIIREVYIQ